MVVRLLEQGATIDEIARRSRLGPVAVMRLIEESYDRRAMAAVQLPKIDTSVLRDMFREWHEQDPERHTFIELARRAKLNPSSSTIQRMLGVAPTSRVVKGSVVYPQRIRTTLPLWTAERLAQAMGRRPYELERKLDRVQQEQESGRVDTRPMTAG